MMSEIGYDGLEIACWGGHLDPKRAAEDPAYVERSPADLGGATAEVLGYWLPPHRGSV